MSITDDMHLLRFTAQEGPSVLRDTSEISYHGSIKPGAKYCWISFPGKFAAGWDALTKELHGDSVACVFLCTPEDGLGEHHTDPEDTQGRCLCHRIYGVRDYERFGYLQRMASPYTEERIVKAKRKADAMNAVHIREDAPPDEMRKAIAEAERRWRRSGCVASWGCEWYHASLLHLSRLGIASSKSRISRESHALEARSGRGFGVLACQLFRGGLPTRCLPMGPAARAKRKAAAVAVAVASLVLRVAALARKISKHIHLCKGP